MKKILVLILIIVAAIAALTVASGCIFYPQTENPVPTPTPIPTEPPVDPTYEPGYVDPTYYPTEYPTDYPTEYPTEYPTYTPTGTRTPAPTFTPLPTPTVEPTKSLEEQGAELITGRWHGTKDERFVIFTATADVTADFKDDGTGTINCIVDGAGQHKNIKTSINYEYLGNGKFNGVVGADSREFTCNGNMIRITINPVSIKPDLPSLADRDITMILTRA